MSTLTVPGAPVEDTTSTSELDLLIPPSMGPGKKFIVSIALIATTISIVVVVLNGYVYPSALASDDAIDARPGFVDSDSELFSVIITLDNDSARTVRLTDLAVDAPGAELVDVIVSDPGYDFPPDHGWGRADESLPVGRGQTGLPAEIRPAGDSDVFASDNDYTVELWLRPTSCETSTPTWGSVTVTVDFGESSFPPISATTTFDEPLWSNERRSGQPTTIQHGEDWVAGNGLLEVVCEALR